MNDQANAQIASSSTAAIQVLSAQKRFGQFTALDKVSLEIGAGEFFTLLGPSGCGKTTLLRLIAGFEDLTSGDILLYGATQAGLPPNRREINTVFQQYALFPLMSVVQNVEFGLLRKGIAKVEARRRALAALEMVHMGSFVDRSPVQLSGGQQQRVALARALAPEPKVLLLDEPLSALDLKLRQKVRLELTTLQRNTGITFIFVTHDQEEALTMSDRIAVMSHGRVQQVGTPEEIYEHPRNRFVADFIGETNLLAAEQLEGQGTQATVRVMGGRPFRVERSADLGVGASHVSIRPENLILTDAEEANISGTVSQHVYLGTDVQIAISAADGTEIMTRVQSGSASTLPAPGSTCHLKVREGRARLVDD
ncbi:ABC transporter ATP-binding protein [Antarcticimicrobium luteum]|uniref:ABC transporter ATP-binding protein n=1 Tax=Antarcticimicrobium luteum TaxID=2547397 RepID=A0A4V3ASN6_9RHOB|nr:ABC transporter ATP-binding protein [Antarcticimicrobium luteum]TDK51392.1 ABC transporter ATP-binding protein [Antarcticimicrobium luteum]